MIGIHYPSSAGMVLRIDIRNGILAPTPLAFASTQVSLLKILALPSNAEVFAQNSIRYTDASVSVRAAKCY